MTSPVWPGDRFAEPDHRAEGHRAPAARSLAWCLYLGAVVAAVVLGVLWCGGGSPSALAVSAGGLLAAVACPLGISLIVLIGARAARRAQSRSPAPPAPAPARRDG